MKLTLISRCLSGALLLGAMSVLRAEPKIVPGATEASPSRSQYFSWINNTNEGATEAQTLANLEFFKWLHDEYGMKLDIYAFDAGNIDGPKYYGSTSTDKFKTQFPRGFDPIYKLAKSFGFRLGVWLGPDGFGDTPEEEQARIDMLAGFCRDYEFALFKMDAFCTQLRPEKQEAFARLMTECRKHSPDLILLNHRLNLGDAKPYATTFLWEGAETYIDVHMANRDRTGTHNRVQAISRGLVPDLQRLTEDHGVCLSSCLDYWEDDLILQAFSRCLILAPEIYANPWFLRDDEFPRLARIYNLHQRYRDIMVKGMVLDEERYGPLAVARGDDATRLVTLRNLTWEPVTHRVKLDALIGFTADGPVEVRQFHPTERILGTFKRGDEVAVEVLPFRSCLLLVDTKQSGGVGLTGADYEVVRDVPGKDVVIRVLGGAGETAEVSLVPGGRKFRLATLDGKSRPKLAAGESVEVRFPGKPDRQSWHRRIGAPAACAVPADAEMLFETTCFALDNDPLEIRSLRRSGPSAIPQVQNARQAFLDQAIIAERGILQEYLFDGDPATAYDFQRQRIRARAGESRSLRLDLGKAARLDHLVLVAAPRDESPDVVVTPEHQAEVSADLKHWSPARLVQDGRNIRIECDPAGPARYVRSNLQPGKLVEELFWAENKDKADHSGVQDMVGLIYPGISRLDFDINHKGGQFPCHIETCNDPEVARWLSSVLYVVTIQARPEGYYPLDVKNLEPAWVRRLGQSGVDCFDGIVAMDIAKTGRSFNECMLCWETLMPGIVRHDTIERDLMGELKFYQDHYPGAMFSGCGGGYFYVLSDTPVPGGFRVTVRPESEES